jgi:hypothetical protein
MVFGIYDNRNVCLSWNETVLWCELLGLKHVPVIYRGIWDENLIREITPGPSIYGADREEGYVVRLAREFHYDNFSVSCAKTVFSKNHVQTSEHWMNQEMVPNELKS